MAKTTPKPSTAKPQPKPAPSEDADLSGWQQRALDRSLVEAKRRALNKSNGFVQFALGSALAATNDLEGAQRALREANTLSPGLLAARVRLAELEARSGAIVSARERLQRVIVLDPEYASAWRALYLLPPEG